MNFGRVEISCSALLIVALLYYFDNNGVIGWVLAAGLLHEMGHWIAIRGMGGQIRVLRLSLAGAEMHLSAVKALSPWQMAIAALAGPGINVLLALGSIQLAGHGVGEKLYFFAGINLGLACFNLLPVDWLDGGKALENLLMCLGDREIGETVVEITSKVVLTLIVLGGLLLLWQSEGKNFTLFIAGLWMTVAAKQKSTASTLKRKTR